MQVVADLRPEKVGGTVSVGVRVAVGIAVAVFVAIGVSVAVEVAKIGVVVEVAVLVGVLRQWPDGLQPAADAAVDATPLCAYKVPIVAPTLTSISTNNRAAIRRRGAFMREAALNLETLMEPPHEARSVFACA